MHHVNMQVSQLHNLVNLGTVAVYSSVQEPSISRMVPQFGKYCCTFCLLKGNKHCADFIPCTQLA